MELMLTKNIDANIQELNAKTSDYKKKGAISLVFSSNTTDWTTQIYPAIVLDNRDNYEVALIDLETYYSFPNIDSTNNQFVYIVGSTPKVLTLPIGSYSIENINSTIQALMRVNGDWNAAAGTYYITITTNTPTLGSAISIATGYSVDFTLPFSLANLLGFNTTLLTAGTYISPNIVNILTVNSIFVNCNIISGSYTNGGLSTVLYSYFPSVGPGYKIIQTPVNAVYLPLISNNVTSVRIWITDQNGNILNFQNEYHTIRLEIRRK